MFVTKNVRKFALTVINALMSQCIVMSTESLAALRAHVRPLAGVTSFMFNKGSLPEEALIAMTTSIRFTVVTKLYVLSQQTTYAVTFATLTALKRLLLAMNHLSVNCQTRPSFKPFSAVFASVRLLAGVSSHVIQQRRHLSK